MNVQLLNLLVFETGPQVSNLSTPSSRELKRGSNFLGATSLNGQENQIKADIPTVAGKS